MKDERDRTSVEVREDTEEGSGETVSAWRRWKTRRSFTVRSRSSQADKNKVIIW